MHACLDQIFNCWQMTEYRARARTTESDQGLVTSSLALEQPPAFMSLAEQYGLDEEDLGAEPDDHSSQSIEQEYQAYITAPVSANGTSIIKWWEVSQGTGTQESMAIDHVS
jgi:hypothetical protein